MRSQTFSGICNLPLGKKSDYKNIASGKHSKQALVPNAQGLDVTVIWHHPTPIQASQIVFPRFIRYENSPVLTPITKKAVKMMMSHKTVLGMLASGNPSVVNAVNGTRLILIIIIPRGKGSGENFFQARRS
jgi:hypothetical protein